MDEDIRQHYLAKHLPAPVRERLEEAWQESQGRPARRRRWIRPAFAAAAVVVLSGTLVALAVLGSDTRDAGDPDLEGMAAALAELHQLRTSLAVETDDFAQIHNALDHAPFELLEPQQLLERGYRLNGARLAELDGETAAVLSLTCPEGYAASLIQLRGTPRLERLEAEGLVHNGLRIKMWMSGAVFCCFVESLPRTARAPNTHAAQAFARRAPGSVPAPPNVSLLDTQARVFPTRRLAP